MIFIIWEKYNNCFTLTIALLYIIYFLTDDIHLLSYKISIIKTNLLASNSYIA